MFLIKNFIIILTTCFAFLLHAADQRIQPDTIYPRIKIETTLGDITVELDRRRAPRTVDNFLTYVVNGEYDGSIFHRIMPGFVAQGGGYNKKYEELNKQAQISNESGNGLLNRQGTIAMARLNDPHSATRQFFFNLADNKHLDPGKDWGYTVFGEIESDLSILEKIESVDTEFNSQLNQPNVPKQLILINRITLLPHN